MAVLVEVVSVALVEGVPVRTTSLFVAACTRDQVSDIIYKG